MPDTVHEHRCDPVLMGSDKGDECDLQDRPHE